MYKSIDILSDFEQIWIFSTDFCKRPPISDFTEIRSAGTTLIYADRRTEVNRRFSRLLESA